MFYMFDFVILGLPRFLCKYFMVNILRFKENTNLYFSNCYLKK